MSGSATPTTNAVRPGTFRLSAFSTTGSGSMSSQLPGSLASVAGADAAADECGLCGGVRVTVTVVAGRLAGWVAHPATARTTSIAAAQLTRPMPLCCPGTLRRYRCLAKYAMARTGTARYSSALSGSAACSSSRVRGFGSTAIVQVNRQPCGASSTR